MKTRIRLLLRIFCTYLCFFALTKPVFMLYNRTICEDEGVVLSVKDVWQVVLHGLPMDVSTTGYFVALPFLFLWLSLIFKNINPRKALTPYYIFSAIVLVSVAIIDTSLYEFWKFKLDATIFNYIDSPKDALASVSIFFVLIRFLCALLLIVGLSWLLIHTTPKRWLDKPYMGIIPSISRHFTMILLGGILFLCIRGGIDESTMNVGNAYFSDRAFLNHSAVNPTFSLLSSMGKSEDFSKQYDYWDEATRAELFNGMYPTDTEDLSDTLLTSSRPNILLIMLEGFGGTFVESLGGIPEVAPNLERLLKEGISFNQFYANSFRTDRGTVSTLSGHVSYPVTSIMKLPAKSRALPSIARSLLQNGYTTDFVYGGDINFTNMKSYLLSMGYERITCDQDFSMAERSTSAWGANDSIVFRRLYKMLQQRNDEQPWFTTLLTLSSHEPFDVPYQRLEDKKLNAFAYTDHCLGQFIEQFKQLPIWDNTLVICLPDHGFLYNAFYTEPAFFHVPMLWMGGAIREPRTIETLMNQSDLAATLLAQLNIPHTEFTYSRNIFSRNYSYPFVYTTFADGFLFADSTGVTTFDNAQQKSVVCLPEDNGMREAKGKALLQSTYDHLAIMGRMP